MTIRVLAVALSLVAGCAQAADTGSDPSPPRGDASELVRAVEGLCAARDQALGSPEMAAATFIDRSHGGIHVLADRVASVDRAIAAAILEAKQQVEAATDASDENALQDAFNELATASADGLQVLGIDEPRCATDGGS